MIRSRGKTGLLESRMPEIRDKSLLSTAHTPIAKARMSAAKDHLYETTSYFSIPCTSFHSSLSQDSLTMYRIVPTIVCARSCNERKRREWEGRQSDLVRSSRQRSDRWGRSPPGYPAPADVTAETYHLRSASLKKISNMD